MSASLLEMSLVGKRDPYIPPQKVTHGLSTGTFIDSDKTWFFKKIQNAEVPALKLEDETRMEWLSQEFFRLLIPHQPETRLVVRRDYPIPTYYITTEAVPGYKQLPQHTPLCFGDGTYRGLGQALIISMFLEEVDLNNGNIGLDKNNRVIKLDGGWCFTANRRLEGKRYPASSFNLSTNAIEQSPIPVDFYTHNWLDYRYKGKNMPAPRIVRAALSSNPLYRAEVNEALLKIALLPDSFIERFVKTYMPDSGLRFLDSNAPVGEKGKTLATLIKERRDTLTRSALQNTSFQSYLSNSHADAHTEELIAHMRTFQTHGYVIGLTDGEADEMRHLVLAKREELRSIVTVSVPAPTPMAEPSKLRADAPPFVPRPPLEMRAYVALPGVYVPIWQTPAPPFPVYYLPARPMPGMFAPQVFGYTGAAPSYSQLPVAPTMPLFPITTHPVFNPLPPRAIVATVARVPMPSMVRPTAHQQRPHYKRDRFFPERIENPVDNIEPHSKESKVEDGPRYGY